MIKPRCVATSLCFAVLTACATSPTPRGDSRTAPNDRVIAFQTKDAQRTASLVVTRDTGFMGGGCYKSVWINGTLAARLDTGERARFFLMPGEYVLRVGRDPSGGGLCSTGQDQWTDRETVLHPNETKNFRLFTDANGNPDVQRAE